MPANSVDYVDEADWEKLNADQLEQINMALSAERDAIVEKQIRLAPIWERKMREERALQIQAQRQLHEEGELPPDQEIIPESIPSEEKMGFGE